MVADYGQTASTNAMGGSAVASSVVAPLAQAGLLGGLLGGVGELVRGVARGVGKALGWDKKHWGNGHGHGKYVEEGTNWEAFTHEELYEMVCGPEANSGQVEALAHDWATEGAQIRAEADELQRSVVKLMQYWEGEAASEAAYSVIDTVGWVSSVGETATAMSAPLQYSAHALAAAQASMPPPPNQSGLTGTPGDRAAVGEEVGGSLGGSLGGVSGGADSGLGTAAAQNQLKVLAVETMKRFETAAVSVDTTTPQFVDTGSSQVGRAAYNAAQQAPVVVDPRPGGGGGGGGGGPAPTNPAGSGGSSGAGSGASSAGSGNSWRGLTGRGIPGGLFGGLPLGGPRGGLRNGVGGLRGGGIGGGPGLGGFGSGFAGGGGAGAGGGGPVPGMPAGAGAGAAGSAAGMRGGMGPMAPMMGAGAGAGQGSEHQRRYPYESEQVFRIDRDVSPPVIGG